MRFGLMFLALVTSVGIAEARGGGGYGTGSRGSSYHVQGYTTSRGTYVAPHRNTMPDSTKLNNYGTNPNYNPWTGKTGTKSGL